MIKKISMVLIIIFCGFSIVYAHIIPGVDRPFDPPAYYSETEISYADSPSTFFYRDLAAGGGTVLDVTRKAKSALFSGDFTSLAGIFTSKTSNDVINTSSFDSSVLEQTSNDIANINQNTTNNAKSSAVLEKRSGLLFRSPDRYDEDTNTYDKKTQLSWLEKTYLSFAQASKDSLDDINLQEEALGRVIENTYNADGDLQAAQASTQMKAFNEAVQASRNSLLANYAALKATRNIAKEDEELENIRKIDKSNLWVTDPYDTTQQEQKVYTRPAAPGFKNF
ncbi:MAG: hypothetical protein H6Q70_78 [Firmicutes bacterium]|nr:hypothetical protein [Bacillota bacterium]